MKIPESMREELQGWNNGKGITLEEWIGCSGNFSLAVGYTSIFNPKFVEFEGYIFSADEVTDDLIQSVRSFENEDRTNGFEVEWVINHEHICDLQHAGCSDLSKDKIVVIGDALKEIYEAKLAYLFPDRPCVVEFHKPENEDELKEYQISFWQKKHERNSV